MKKFTFSKVAGFSEHLFYRTRLCGCFKTHTRDFVNNFEITKKFD